MGLNLRINIPAIRLPPPITLPPVKLIPLPPVIKIPPLKDVVKQISLLSKPLVIPPIKSPVKIDINIAGLPKVSIRDPVLKVPELQIPKQPPVPKPVIDMKGLKIATGIIVGALEVFPITKPFVMAGMGIADAASKGKATEFVTNGRKTNGMLSMVPGGLLIQNIANEASNGKSGSTLSTYVPDGKKMIMQDAIAVAKTLSTDPKSTLNTVKSVSVSNVNTIKKSRECKIN
jgi:hypothetical protein